MQPEAFLKKYANKYINKDILAQYKEKKPLKLYHFAKPLKSKKDVECLANLLESYPVSELYLTYYKLTDEECKILAKGISQAKGLTAFGYSTDVKNCKVSMEGHKIILQALSLSQSLSQLTFHHTDFKNSQHKKMVIDTILSCQSLISLTIDGRSNLAPQNSSYEDLKDFFSILPQCPKLSELSFNYTSFGDKGINTLASVLPQCHSLKRLLLQENRDSTNYMSSEGMKALLRSLPYCTSLVSLHIEANSGSQDFVDSNEFIEALSQCQSLTAVTLRNRHDNGNKDRLKKIATNLPRFPHITSLDLAPTEFFRAYDFKNLQEVDEFTQMISKCPNLVSFKLHTDSIGMKEAYEKLEAACNQNLQKNLGMLNAAANNNLDLVKRYLQEGVTLRARDENLNTALHVSAANGHLEMVRFLLEHDPALFSITNSYKTPLEVAEEAHQTKVVDYLKHFSVVPAANLLSQKTSVYDESPLQPLPSAPSQSALLDVDPVVPQKPAVSSSFFSSSSSSGASATRHHNNNNAPNANLLTPLLSTPASAHATVSPEVRILGDDTDSLAIPKNQLVFEETLGEGGFGTVYKGLWKHTKLHHTPIAIKQLKLTSLSAKVAKDFKQEVEMQSNLTSPHIVKLYGITAEEPYCMIMELMSKGSVRDILDATTPDTFPWEMRLSIAYSVASALVYLHTHQPPIIHGDLKSLNILLNDQMQAKVADFGLATLKVNTLSRTNQQEAGKAKGSLLWMPPELFKMNGKKNPMTDMYSFAVLLWELASHAFPYESAQGDEGMIRGWVTGGERETFDERTPNTPPEYQALVETCWAQEPAKRLPAAEAAKRLEALQVFGKNPSAPVFFLPAEQEKAKLLVSQSTPNDKSHVPARLIGNQYVEPSKPSSESDDASAEEKTSASHHTATPAVGNLYYHH